MRFAILYNEQQTSNVSPSLGTFQLSLTVLVSTVSLIVSSGDVNLSINPKHLL